jgi:hypothetical protein
MRHDGYSDGSRPCHSMFPIPVHMVGYIVGKNGERIRQIMDASATKISIEGPSSNDVCYSKMSIIVGSAECVQLARTLIEHKLYEGRLMLRVR